VIWSASFYSSSSSLEDERLPVVTHPPHPQLEREERTRRGRRSRAMAPRRTGSNATIIRWTRRRRGTRYLKRTKASSCCCSCSSCPPLDERNDLGKEYDEEEQEDWHAVQDKAPAERNWEENWTRRDLP